MENLNFFDIEWKYDMILDQEEKETGVKTRLLSPEERLKYGYKGSTEKEFVIKLTKVDDRIKNSHYKRVLYEDYIHFTVDISKQRYEKMAMFIVDSNRKANRKYTYYEIALCNSKSDKSLSYSKRRDWNTHKLMKITGREMLF